MDRAAPDFSRLHLVLGSIVVPMAVVDAVLARAVGLQNLRCLLDVWPAVAALGVVLLYCRWRRIHVFVPLAVLPLWFIAVFSAFGVLLQLAARSPSALADLGLARVDARLHLETATVVGWISRSPTLRQALEASYPAVGLLVVAAIALPSLSGRLQDAERYLVAIAVAAVSTAGLFALYPAVGPWTVYPLKPTPMQAQVGEFLLRLKSGSPVPFDIKSGAIVSFPSFHVILTLLSVLALWGTTWTRWLTVPLALAICASTVTTGWHYTVDVAGGLGVAAVAQWAAARLIAREGAPRPELDRARGLAPLSPK